MDACKSRLLASPFASRTVCWRCACSCRRDGQINHRIEQDFPAGSILHHHAQICRARVQRLWRGEQGDGKRTRILMKKHGAAIGMCRSRSHRNIRNAASGYSAFMGSS